MDRLTDHNPEKKEDERKDRVMSWPAYQKGFMRDLLWLLSASQHRENEDFMAYDHVKTSSVNYGIRNLYGLTITPGSDAYDLERNITQAIEAFEPRLARDSLEVRMKQNEQRKNEWMLEIRGDLWAQPAPEEMLIKTRMDLETGEVSFA